MCPKCLSIKMVFVGYETWTKGYRVYDPISRKLHISRDVIFEESKGWDWKPHAQADPVTSVFDVEFYTIAGQGTVNDQQNAEAAEDLWEHENEHQGSPAQSQWSINTESSAGADQSTPPGSPLGQGVEFATPPTRDSVDSDGVPMRFRTVDNLNDTTEEIHGFEYSGLCYFAAEEPRSVEQALADECWRDAMMTEMNSI